VLIAGLLLVALGTAFPFMTSTLGLIFAIGVLAAGGAGMAGPAVLMAATTRLVPLERRGMAAGIVNAGGSFGQFVFAPIAQGITAAAGWVIALQSLAALTLLALPAAWGLRTRAAPTAAGVGAAASATPARRETVGQALSRAWALPSYRWLCAGFFVCGFHVAFIATHLPGVVASCQLPPEVGAWSLGVIGLFNIVGSLTVGWAMGYQGGRWRMKSLLSLIYATRALVVLVFVFAPKTSTTMLFTQRRSGSYLSTVPPTRGWWRASSGRRRWRCCLAS
jgi:predicted MFS family arabinose efflux permease